jgi:hypothetical protein
MHTRIVLLALLMVVAAGCKSVDCGDGTIERNGTCVASSQTIGTAICGPGTEPNANLCVPSFPPTMCDPTTTQEDVDENGVTTCVGIGGGGGCSAKIACPSPTDGKQTICGQLYDFETNQPFADPSATGGPCTAGCMATSGPCALAIKAYDAVVFAGSMGASGQLTTGPVYIDDCGRFRVSEIAQPGPPGLIALGVDDAAPPPGPGGITNAVGIATAAAPNTATKDVEAFIVKPSTTASWGATPSLAAGIYAPVFRTNKTGTDLAAGVTVTFAPMSNPTQMSPMPARDFYFASGSTNRTTLDANANATTTDGTALVSGATLTEVYSGAGGGIPSTCLWEVHGGAAVPGVVFIQIFRPMNFPGMTCPL